MVMTVPVVRAMPMSLSAAPSPLAWIEAHLPPAFLVTLKLDAETVVGFDEADFGNHFFSHMFLLLGPGSVTSSTT
jgi:hypothetical protein